MIKYRSIKHILTLDLDDDYEIQGIVNHHQHMKRHYIYVLRKGEHFDPSIYIDTLCQQGIVLHEDKTLKQGCYVEHLSQVVNSILDVYYRSMPDSLTLIGVCGTNGKSSVAHNIYECLAPNVMKITTGLVAYQDQEMKQENTTPDEISLLHYLDMAYQANVKYVVMEVSSQGIDQGRVQRVYFDYIVYTNIASDHLDYHKTLLHYRYSKYKLLNKCKSSGKVIACADELYYAELKALCSNQLISYGVCSSHFQIEKVKLEMQGSSFLMNGYTCETQLLGLENIYNMSATIALLRLIQMPYQEIIERLQNITCHPGRMQLIAHDECYVYVDYAHTSYAFYKSMRFFNQIKQARLIVVVGCGGQREIQKRKEIGHYASELSDICIFTEDNSRNEDILNIIEDMCERVVKEVIIIENRQDAIVYAIQKAQKNDIILISGKGNEDTLSKGNQKIKYNDADVIRKVMER